MSAVSCIGDLVSSGDEVPFTRGQTVGQALRSEHVRIDRLSRSLLDFHQVHELMKRQGVQFWSLNESFDTSTAVGRAMLKLVLVFAELEREQTAERTRHALEARAQRGLWNGGHPPLGYESEGSGHLTVNAAEAELVRLIFARYLELRSTNKLARWLNEQGHRQKRYTSRRRGETAAKPSRWPWCAGC